MKEDVPVPNWVPQWMALMTKAGMDFRVRPDAFTATVPQLLNYHGWDWACDCPAKGIEMAMHTEFCSTTPTFANLAASIGAPSDITKPITNANLAMTQTVIKCAECGRELLGRDADVIYRPPEGNTMPSPGFVWHSPKRIVKAVCPHHNRTGSVGYQRQAWAGY